MLTCVTVFLIHVLNGVHGQNLDYPFAFGNTLGDNMVLQQAPWRAKVWGTCPTKGCSVVIKLMLQSNLQLIETITTTGNSAGVWSTYLNPRVASNNGYKITATNTSNSSVSLVLDNILFGDVFICSGQSNMQITVQTAFNGSDEVQDANNYPYIRVFTAAQIGANDPQLNLLGMKEPWSVASNRSIAGGNWSYMSAVCWFFGKNMYKYKQYPIGLIGTDYGGTAIRLWSSPDALSKCNESYAMMHKQWSTFNRTKNDSLATDPRIYAPNPLELSASGLWNAMIYPFLQTTIRAAIWYQGEADSNPTYAAPYACQFPAMIEDWRTKWHLYSDTSPDFPFGFVQLSTWEDDSANKPCGNDIACQSVAIVRWAQTANYGYVPNAKMPNTFMATAVDLGDPKSPFGDVHPRYKQQVSDRLSDAGKAVIYGESGVYWLGPIATHSAVNGENIRIYFRNMGEQGVRIKNSDGFEVYDKSSSTWVTVTGSVVSNDNGNVVDIAVPSTINDVNDVSQVRYLWFQAPCNPMEGIYGCAIYDEQFGLPATPFLLAVSNK